MLNSPSVFRDAILQQQGKERDTDDDVSGECRPSGGKLQSLVLKMNVVSHARDDNKAAKDY